MTDQYLEYYILSYFSLNRITRLSQIVHVFNGKRTPSMFYLIEKNKWHHGFLLDYPVDEQKFNGIIQRLKNNQWIIEEEKGFLLTTSGEEACKDYFDHHFYPEAIKRITYTSARTPFWNRLQLFTQVFSELSYENKQYIPVIKHPHHQENVRLLFSQFGEEKEKLLERWVKEQTFIFKQLKQDTADVLARLLTGHEQIGDTKAQIAQEFEMTPLEIYFYLQAVFEEVIQIILDHRSKLKLIYTILNQLHMETNQGLSASTKQTVQMLKEGHTVEQIGQIRSIKTNTVREHILEVAFVNEDFPYQKFIPAEIYTYLNQRFDADNSFRYGQAADENDAIEFMHFRLVELERMRKDEE